MAVLLENLLDYHLDYLCILYILINNHHQKKQKTKKNTNINILSVDHVTFKPHFQPTTKNAKKKTPNKNK